MITRSPYRRVLLVASAVFALEVLTNARGWWWTTIVAGLVAGATGRRLCRRAVTTTASASLLAWLAGAFLAAGAKTADAASALSALALGDPKLGPAWLVVTGVYAAILALASGWFTAAVRRLFIPAPEGAPRRSPAVDSRITPRATSVPGPSQLTEEAQHA
ncbi:MAG: hypothetical protein WCB04_15415 [Mycobacteriales bacterium]